MHVLFAHVFAVYRIAYIEVANIIAYFMQRCTEQTPYFPASIGIYQFSIRWGHFYFEFFSFRPTLGLANRGSHPLFI